MTSVILLYHGSLFCGPFHPIASWFITKGKECERRMVAISITDANSLIIKVFVYELSPTQLHSMVRPRWSFRLKIHSRHVCCKESSLRRAVGMEAHMIEAPLLTRLEENQPCLKVRRRITGIWEIAVLDSSTQLYLLAVNIEHLPTNFYLSHAEICSKLTHLFTLIQFCRQTVHLRIILIPQKHPVAHIKGYFLHVSILDLHRLLSNDDMTCISIK